MISSWKFLFFLATVLVLLMSAQSQARDLCQRPKSNFENIKHVNEYIECLKSQTTTRYGKRGYPSSFRLGKIRPDLYIDSDALQKLYDNMLYGDGASDDN